MVIGGQLILLRPRKVGLKFKHHEWIYDFDLSLQAKRSSMIFKSSPKEWNSVGFTCVALVLWKTLFGHTMPKVWGYGWMHCQ
jgi:hypothetical protein